MKYPFAATILTLFKPQRSWRSLRFESIITTVLTLLMINVTGAATYYIDKITGADSNNGLSPEAAWQNVEKVNETTFSPGDSILFKRGQVWFNTLWISAQGTEEQPVYFGAYGDGGKPRFDAQDRQINGISIRGAAYVHVYNLVSFNTGINSVGISIMFSHHLLLRKVDALFSANWEKGSGPGMTIHYESHHIVVDSATVIKSKSNGIWVGSSPNQRELVRNVTISNCYVSQTKYNDGIVVHEGTPYDGSWLVGDSIVFRNNYSELAGNEEGYDVTAGSDILLENNISHGNYAGGITVAHTAKNVVIKNHISYGEPKKPGGPQIQISGNWGTTSNYEVSGCLFLNTQGYMLIVRNKDVRVHNNTFIWNGERGDGILISTPAESVVFKNNIFTTRGDYISRTTFLLSGNPIPPLFVFDNNIYYPPDNFMFFNSRQTKFYGFENWQTVMKQDSHSVTLDPQLVDIAGGDYRLLPTSPAIDTLAADIRIGQRDILGTLIPYGDGPDVGAFEYTPELAGFHIPVPAPPTDLIATNSAPGQVKLTWSDNSDNEFGFRIDRALEGEDFDFVDIVESGMTSYTDTTVAVEQRQYSYHVRAYNNRGNSKASNTVSVVTAVRTQPTATAPTDFKLYANYPNPFNPSTTIRYALPATARVRIEIYDVSGRLVDTLVDDVGASGDHNVSWEARNSAGEAVAAGLYFCVMTADEFRLVRKMILVK